MLPPAASINILPDDVLVEIFTMHVWNNSDTPYSLLRICKRWHSVTTNTSSLWGNLLLCDKLPAKNPVIHDFGTISLRALNNKIICRSVASLAVAIERTGGSMFELFIVPPYRYQRSVVEEWGALQSSWFLKRCRALELVAGYPGHLISRINALPMLERLEIHKRPGYNITSKDSIVPFLEIAERTSKRLRLLRTPTHKSASFHELQDIYGRLNTLHIWVDNNENSPIEEMTKAATNVTTLGVVRQSSIPFPFQIDSACSSVDSLTLAEIPYHMITPSLASTIRHLSIKGHHYSGDISLVIELPRLTHLTCSQAWENIIHIKASNLEVLKLRSGTDIHLRPRNFECIRQTRLRPATLDLDLRGTEQDVADLIRDHWKTIKNLHITYTRRDHSLYHKLAGHLKGKDSEEPLCPNLHKLVILSPKRTKVNQHNSERLLRTIRDALKNNGTLEEVKYGWYDYRWYVGLYASADDVHEYNIAWTNVMG